MNDFAKGTFTRVTHDQCARASSYRDDKAEEGKRQLSKTNI